MPTRSWLAKAKSVHDLAKDYYIPRSSQNYDWDLEAAREARSRQRVHPPVPVAEEWRAFYGSRMHDSWAMSVERTPKVVRVKLDSIDADIFAIGLADILVVDRVRRQWPVDLLLHDPVYMRVARYMHDGSLAFYDVRRLRSEKPHEGPQFLNDWFFEEDGRLQWIATFDVSEWPLRPNRSSSAFLMVDCHRVSAVDYRAAALKEAFGSAVLPLWEDALAGVDVGDEPYGCWSASTMESFLLRRLSHHGIRRADFEV